MKSKISSSVFGGSDASLVGIRGLGNWMLYWSVKIKW